MKKKLVIVALASLGVGLSAGALLASKPGEAHKTICFNVEGQEGLLKAETTDDLLIVFIPASKQVLGMYDVSSLEQLQKDPNVKVVKCE